MNSLSFPGFYLNDTSCGEDAIGMETGVIPNSNITASSNVKQRPPRDGRLGLYGSWRPRPNDTVNAFLQIDLGVAHYVCAVATQGNPSSKLLARYVTKYGLQLSLNGINWTEYEEV